MIALFILIYLVSLVIHLVLCYKENERHIFYMRDLLDEIYIYMWCPIINTLVLIVYALGICIIVLWKAFKLDVIWERFRNIKLK